MKIILLSFLVLYSGATLGKCTQLEKLAASSKDGNYLVRVTAGNYSESSPAKATIYKYENDTYSIVSTFHLLNHRSPRQIIITNEATIFTFDDWCYAGDKNAVNIYAIDGTVIQNYNLEHLFSVEYLENFEPTTMGRYWMESFSKPQAYLEEVFVIDAVGGVIVFDSKTGKHECLEGNHCAKAM